MNNSINKMPTECITNYPFPNYFHYNSIAKHPPLKIHDPEIFNKNIFIAQDSGIRITLPKTNQKTLPRPLTKKHGFAPLQN